MTKEIRQVLVILDWWFYTLFYRNSWFDRCT